MALNFQRPGAAGRWQQPLPRLAVERGAEVVAVQVPAAVAASVGADGGGMHVQEVEPGGEGFYAQAVVDRTDHGDKAGNVARVFVVFEGVAGRGDEG